MDGAVGTRSVPLHRAHLGRRTCVPRARPVRDMADAGPSAGGIGGRRPFERSASPGTVGHWPRPVARRLSPVVESGARGRNEHRQRLLQRGSTAGGWHGWMGLSELDLSPCSVLTLAEERVCHGLGPCGTWRTRARRRVALAGEGRPNAVHRLALSGTGLGQWHTGFRRWSSRVQGDATRIDSVCCNEDRQRAGGTDGWGCRNSICPLAPCSPWPKNVCATGSARAGRGGRGPVGGWHWRKKAVRTRSITWHRGALASASGTQAFAGGRVGCKGTQRGSTASTATRIDSGRVARMEGAVGTASICLAPCLCWPKSVCVTGSARAEAWPAWGTFVWKRQNRRVCLVPFPDDHSRFITGYPKIAATRFPARLSVAGKPPAERCPVRALPAILPGWPPVVP